MMSDTPRVFVGTTTFLLARASPREPICRR